MTHANLRGVAEQDASTRSERSARPLSSSHRGISVVYRSYLREVAKAAPLIEQERRLRGGFQDLQDVCRRCSFLSREQLEWLALAGALDGLCASRRETLWSLPALHVGHGGKAKEKEIDGQTAVDMDVPPLLPKGLNDFTFSERFAREGRLSRFPLPGIRWRSRGSD